MSDELNVVYGGTGNAGAAIVRELLARGKRVRVVSRKPSANLPAGAEFFQADASNAAATLQAAQGASVLFNALNAEYTKWLTEFPPMHQAVIAAAEATGAKLVFADNLYAYGLVPMPMTEESPLNPPNPKTRLRVDMAEQILTAHRTGKIRGTIGRASDFYGIEVGQGLGNIVLAAIAARKTPNWLGNADQLHALTYVDDYAKGLVTLSEREEALGQVWHIPNAEPVTGRQFINLASEIAGVKPKMMVAGAFLLNVVGLFTPAMKELTKVLYQYDRPFTVDHSKYQRTFGDVTPTPHRIAIKTTLDWYSTRQQSEVKEGAFR